MRQALPFFGKSAAGEYLANVHREAAATPSTLLVDVDDLVNAGRLPTSTGFEAEERLLAARMSRLEVQQALHNAAEAVLELLTMEAEQRKELLASLPER